MRHRPSHAAVKKTRTSRLVSALAVMTILILAVGGVVLATRWGSKAGAVHTGAPAGSAPVTSPAVAEIAPIAASAAPSTAASSASASSATSEPTTGSAPTALAPTASSTTTGSPVTVASGSAQPTTSAAVSSTVTYTVKPGDTLSGIAEWFKLHGYGALYAANAKVIGANPNLIFPGQRITISNGVMTLSRTS